MNGPLEIEILMEPVDKAITKHIPYGDAWTEIHNRCYEALYKLLKEKNDKPSINHGDARNG